MTGRLGPQCLSGDRCEFRVWAPNAERVSIQVESAKKRTLPLDAEEYGYHAGTLDDIHPGTRYRVLLDDQPYPDPASRFQPDGVHGPSEVIHPDFEWTDDAWNNRPLQEYVIYELHVGTFTNDGTFDAAIAQLDALQALGITAIEVMPVAQNPGARNWGYDGVGLYATQASYGGPDAFRRFIDACHARDLAVVLDVVYNHLGPEGNYLGQFGPYFTDRYHTPWGNALNFDGGGSDAVREYFFQNAEHWFRDFHIDALRLDAIHAIVDDSARPFLWELQTRIDDLTEDLERPCYLTSESDANDPRIVNRKDRGGFGHAAVWNDDFHHALHALITGERQGYYQDFGCVADLAKAFEQGFIYTGQYSQYRSRRHGRSSAHVPGHRFVCFGQNHDQIGNRAGSERINTLAGWEGLKVANTATVLAPGLPLLYMGQEYGETAPFFYFVDHSDKKLQRAVREGRKAEFKAFDWTSEPPDPNHEKTFRASRLNHELKQTSPYREILAYTERLLRLRREHPACATLDEGHVKAYPFEDKRTLVVHRVEPSSAALFAFNFGDAESTVQLKGLEGISGVWSLGLDSSAPDWGGPGAGASPELDLEGGATLSITPMTALVYLQSI